MQQALFVSNSLSLQAIYDTLFAEAPISNFKSYMEFHNEFPLVQHNLVPSSLLIAAPIQKHHYVGKHTILEDSKGGVGSRHT
jgi:hypothetical protein